MNLVEKIVFISSDNGRELGKYLRAVASELERASLCLDGTTSDMIDFFDEVNKKVCGGR